MKRLFKFIVFLAVLCILAYVGYNSYNKVIRYMYPTDYAYYINKYADECELDRSLVYSVIKCESGYDKNAVSSVGAVGLMQLTPETYEWVSTKYKSSETISSNDLYTPEINIEAGCHLLKLHINEFGSIETALAAYHAGRGKVNEWLKNDEYSQDGKTLVKIPYSETSSYVKKVINTIQKYQNIYNIK